VMCDLEDIPGREAAAVLAIPEGTLYRRVHEARRALRALVEEGQP
jgi:DNA-directed RNA polymerase specialized sigma24 family protein